MPPQNPAPTGSPPPKRYRHEDIAIPGEAPPYKLARFPGSTSTPSTSFNQPSPPSNAPSPPDDARRPPKKRVGQACQRCKERKVKCDCRPGSCENCLRSGAVCLYKDLNTKEDKLRGHDRQLQRTIETLQNDNDALKADVAHRNGEVSHYKNEAARFRSEITRLKADGDVYKSECERVKTDNERKLRELAVLEARVKELSDAVSSVSPMAYIAMPNTPVSDDDPHVLPTLPYPQRTSRLGAMFSPPRDEPAANSRHMGIPSTQGALQQISRMTGYTLSVFGWKMNALEMVPASTWADCEEMSWKFFLRNMHSAPHPKGTKPTGHARLPADRHDCERMAEIYMAFINAWHPVISRDQLAALVRKIYDSSADPNEAELTPAEVCRIHMVLALVKYNRWFKDRSDNPDQKPHWDEIRQQVIAHYIFTVKHFHHLMQNHSLDTLQAAVLVCGFLAKCPHPGAVWMMTHWSMAIAIDLNLHRSFDNLAAHERREIRAEDIELRKRIFWSIFSMRVMSCGSLSRPIELRYEDFDIEIPDVVHDTPNHIQYKVSDQKCSFRASIEFFKLTELYRDTYNDIYPIRPTANYSDRVAEIEERQTQWRRSLPGSLSRSDFEIMHEHRNEFSAFADVLASADAKLTLALNHPAVCSRAKGDRTRLAMQKNVEACVCVLECAERLRLRKSLEVTWSATTTYVAAMFTLLWVNYALTRYSSFTEERRVELYNNLWLGMLALEAVGKELGNGDQLVTKMQQVIKAWHDMAKVSYTGWQAHMERPAPTQTEFGPADTSPATLRQYLGPDALNGSASESMRLARASGLGPRSMSWTGPEDGPNFRPGQQIGGEASRSSSTDETAMYSMMQGVGQSGGSGCGVADSKRRAPSGNPIPAIHDLSIIENDPIMQDAAQSLWHQFADGIGEKTAQMGLHSPAARFDMKPTRQQWPQATGFEPHGEIQSQQDAAWQRKAEADSFLRR